MKPLVKTEFRSRLVILRHDSVFPVREMEFVVLQRLEIGVFGFLLHSDVRLEQEIVQ